MVMNKKYNIMIHAVPHYLESQSFPELNRYTFAYTITITNKGSVAAKLLNRTWLINDANGKTQEVHGVGVVGEQPHLKPGESFTYTSGASIESVVGTMEGSYTMQSDDGENFVVPIPKFTLSIPRTLH
jgi:ApaG protein